MSQLCTPNTRQSFRLFAGASNFRRVVSLVEGWNATARHLAWPVLIGWLIRVAVAAFLIKQFLDPARDHWEFGYEMGHLARSIVMKHGFSDPYWAHTGPSAIVTPVYPYLLAAIFAVFGVFTKASAWAMLSLNCCFSAITAIPIFFIARKTFDLSTAKLAAWVWAFFPYSINFAAATMWYHGFVALLLSSIFLLALFLQSNDNLAAWVGFGARFGFAALTNPVILGIVPAIGIWLIVRLARLRKSWIRASAAGTFAMILTILPWPVRNFAVLHQTVPFKDGFWLEVCVGNVNNSLHWWDAEEHPSGSDREARRFQRLGEFDYMAAKRREALAYIKNHPGQYAWRSFRHVVFLWTGFWSFDRAYLHQEPFDYANIVLATTLTILALAGLGRLHAESRSVLYSLVLLFYPLPYYATHVDPGFRHPLDPILVVLACSTFLRWLNRQPIMIKATREVGPEGHCYQLTSAHLDAVLSDGDEHRHQTARAQKLANLFAQLISSRLTPAPRADT